MSLIVNIVGSPSADSRTLALAHSVGLTLANQGFDVKTINVRELPAEDLIFGRSDSAALRDAFGLVERARGVVVATPIYKAAYTGVLKSFLDLMPQFGFAARSCCRSRREAPSPTCWRWTTRSGRSSRRWAPCMWWLASSSWTSSSSGGPTAPGSTSTRRSPAASTSWSPISVTSLNSNVGVSS